MPNNSKTNDHCRSQLLPRIHRSSLSEASINHTSSSMLPGIDGPTLPHNATADHNSATYTNDDAGSTLLPGINRSALSTTTTNNSTSNLSSSTNDRCSKMLSRFY